MRLDRLLVEKGLIESREKALRSIMAGDVLVDGQRADKAGALVSTEAELDLKGRSPYVSRGGEKLVHALEHFGIGVKGRICVDVGASTGGFTDCLLQRGASIVYAVDVGSAAAGARPAVSFSSTTGSPRERSHWISRSRASAAPAASGLATRPTRVTQAPARCGR